ncbi:MAG: exodeoxyribonuclease VII small subunit [Lachnospiraceae bacterium]|nr:exodeoxyribonuclease VII small subunit [Lachnospiraceae bacterium]
MSENKDNNNLTLEENMRALDEVIRELEKGDLTLEQSFEMYKKGMDLLMKCNNSVDKVEKELQIMESEGI